MRDIGLACFAIVPHPAAAHPRHWMSEFERWQTRFSAPGYLFGTEPNGFLKRQTGLLKPGQKALTVADGEGRNGVFLAQCGLDVTAFDFSPVAIDKARKLAHERGVTLKIEQANLFEYSWPDEAFDVVVAVFIQFAAPAQRATVFDGMRRALKRGGLLLIEGYTPKQREYKTGGPSEVENLYTRTLLEQSFSGFASLDIKEYDAEIEEGAGHGGISALIDLVGRK